MADAAELTKSTAGKYELHDDHATLADRARTVLSTFHALEASGSVGSQAARDAFMQAMAQLQEVVRRGLA